MRRDSDRLPRLPGGASPMVSNVREKIVRQGWETLRKDLKK